MKRSDVFGTVSHSTQALVTTRLLLWSVVCQRCSQTNASMHNHMKQTHTHTPLSHLTRFHSHTHTLNFLHEKDVQFLSSLSGQLVSFRQETRPRRWMDFPWHIPSAHQWSERNRGIYWTASDLVIRNTTYRSTVTIFSCEYRDSKFRSSLFCVCNVAKLGLSLIGWHNRPPKQKEKIDESTVDCEKGRLK